MSSNSNGTQQTIGDRVNFFDSETGQFDVDRTPKDPTKPTHEDTDAPADVRGASESEDTDRDIPTIDEMLDRGGVHDQVTGVNRDAFVAGSLLRSIGNPPLYCPECFYQFGDEVEMSDPEHHLPLVEKLYRQDENGAVSVEIQRHDHRRHRHCPECGVVSFGGVLGDRSTKEFAEVLDTIFEAMDKAPGQLCRRLKKEAVDRKTNDGLSDEANLEQILRDLRVGE